jgi:hypothetical protein
MKEITKLLGGKSVARRDRRVHAIYQTGGEKELLSEQLKRKKRAENAAIDYVYRRHVTRPDRRVDHA